MRRGSLCPRGTSKRRLALAPLLVATLLAPILGAQEDVELLERFALADDRAAALRDAIPDREEVYYYQCLERQHAGDFAAVAPLLVQWIEAFGRSDMVEEIENRQALLTAGRDPDAAFAFLRQRLDLHFAARRELPGEPVDLPIRLDPSLVSRGAFLARVLRDHPGSLDGVKNSGLEFVARENLDLEQLGDWLERLQRPDVPNLPALIVRQLEQDSGTGFGGSAIHGQLLLEQLEECARLRPELLQDQDFIGEWLRRLRPNADVDVHQDAAARAAYLERLSAFADRLSPAQNSLKAHVLGNRLRHDLALGVVDRARLRAFLRLPTLEVYVNPEWRKLRDREDRIATLTAPFPTGLPAVDDAAQLVREAFLQILKDDASSDAWTEFVREDWLRPVFAEAKLLAGEGDPARWYAMFEDPSDYEAVRDRVELRFPAAAQIDFLPDDKVALEVDVKNVSNLLVKVFQIHTRNYYRDFGREVDPSIELDGLVAREEQTFTYDEAPVHRVRRRFEFPSLSSPGVYVVEFTGGGVASRAVIHKGRLQLRAGRDARGHVLRILDESGRWLREARAILGSREFSTDAQGEVVVPYTSEPGERTVLLLHGDRASVATLDLHGEDYRLEASAFVEREALVAGREAGVILRPRLFLGDVPISIALLQDPVLTIEARDVDGVASRIDRTDLELRDSAELIHTFRVPAGLATVHVQLRGTVRSVTGGEDVELISQEVEFPVDAINQTARTASPLLGRTEAGYVLDVLGKNGEPRAEVPVTVRLVHRDFKGAKETLLKTDAAGRIYLGALPGIVSVAATGLPEGYGAWPLRPEARTWPERIHGVVGETLRLPLPGGAGDEVRARASLLEVRDGVFVANRIDRVFVTEGTLELRDLPPGAYDLWLKEPDVRIAVQITDGEVRDGWAVGRNRMLERRPPPLRVVEASVERETLSLHLADAGDRARVHVFRTRYLPTFDPLAGVRVTDLPAPRVAARDRAESWYGSERTLDATTRYVLERRFANKLPGNLLERPGLLLNRWAVPSPEYSGGGGGGPGMGARGPGDMVPGDPEDESAPLSPGAPPGTFADLAFLPRSLVVAANLRPDAEGWVRVPLTELGDGPLVHAVVVSSTGVAYLSRVLPETPLAPRDLRLKETLDPARQQREITRIERVLAGQSATIDDVSGARLATYDSLAAVHRLFLALTADRDLARFAFVLRWPSLDVDEKARLYSEHACHELHLFLRQKDPAFFDAVVRPYLANKMDKTFLDHYVLDDDLSAYLEPWAFAQRNAAEQALLCRRMPGEALPGARLMRDRLSIRTPAPDREQRLAEAALRSGLLEEGALSLGAEVTPGASENVSGGAPSDLVEQVHRFDVRTFQRSPGPTRVYVEQNYWRRTVEESGPDLITIDPFWRDLAQTPKGEPFLSPHVPEAAGSFAEMMLALSVLDLPFEAEQHKITRDGARLTLVAGSPILLAREELRPAAPAKGPSPILLQQQLVRLDERAPGVDGALKGRATSWRSAGVTDDDDDWWGDDDDEDDEDSWDDEDDEDSWDDDDDDDDDDAPADEVDVESALVRVALRPGVDELLPGVPYALRLVLTNPSDEPVRLDVLSQVPSGAIPLLDSDAVRSDQVLVGPFRTEIVERGFYFPSAGDFDRFPFQITRDALLVGSSGAGQLTVVATASRVDLTSWSHLSQAGSNEEVLAYLSDANVLALDLSKIAWRMQDRAFFGQTLDVLRARHAFDKTLWSYGLLHQNSRSTAEYLRHTPQFLVHCGAALHSDLLVLDPVLRGEYQHLEFAPLIIPRAHPSTGLRPYLNPQLEDQYAQLLDVLAHQPALDDADWMSVTYYLLLQGRTAEALATFARVDRARVVMTLQYDYLRAYLGFFTLDTAGARAIAERHQDHPVTRWRGLFREVLAQLDEAEGRGAVGRNTPGNAVIAEEPSLDLDQDGDVLRVTYEGLASLEVRYYAMDVELLFSRDPFDPWSTENVSYVVPNRSRRVGLPSDRSQVALEMPEDLRRANVLVEVEAEGLRRTATRFAHRMRVAVFEQSGHLKVTDEDGRPLPQVYIKVYRAGRRWTEFHKDGYTDLRGRFDYAALTDVEPAAPKRFAILILSDEHGAVIREVGAPLR